MSLLRAQQRTLTALFPHPGNRTHLIRNNRAGPHILGISFKTTATLIGFDEDIAGGDATGFKLFSLGVEIAIIAAVNGAPNEISVTHAPVVLDDKATISYQPGAWVGSSSGVEVKGFIADGTVAP